MDDDVKNSILVFDVGGSHVSAAVCRRDDFRLGPMARAPYPAAQASEAFVELLYSLGVEAGFSCSREAGATLAVPGPFDFQNGISQMRHKLPYLYGIDLRRALADRFGWQPCQIRFLNDADAFLLGEIGAGAARGFGRSVGLTLGTGIGSSYAVNGRIVSDGVGVPKDGEIWNLDYEGGMVEDFVSTRAIQGAYERRTGKRREVVEVAAVAPGDPAAAEAFAEFGQHLGRVLERFLAGFVPDVVVLGGGISRSAHLFLPATQKQLGNPALQLRISELQDSAALVGCGVASLS